jgi:hypothetical protein
LRYSDFQTADEIFSTGNYTKVSHQARKLYWDYAHSGA